LELLAKERCPGAAAIRGAVQSCIPFESVSYAQPVVVETKSNAPMISPKFTFDVTCLQLAPELLVTRERAGSIPDEAIIDGDEIEAVAC